MLLTASAVAPSVTVPIENQLPPALLEYCQLPCVPALALLPTTAMPLKLAPLSTSANWPVKIVPTDWPAGLAVSSATDTSVPLPRFGASLTALTKSTTDPVSAL